MRQTSCGYHVCHISTKESVALIRRAKSEGLDVTCETAPHYLLMDETMLQEESSPVSRQTPSAVRIDFIGTVPSFRVAGWHHQRFS